MNSIKYSKKTTLPNYPNKTEKEENLPNSFYEATITLIPKPDNDGVLTGTLLNLWVTLARIDIWLMSQCSNLWFLMCLVTLLCPTLCDPMDYSPEGSSVHGDSPGNNTGVGCHTLLQRIFPTQVSCTEGRFFTIWATLYLFWFIASVFCNYQHTLVISTVRYSMFISAIINGIFKINILVSNCSSPVCRNTIEFYILQNSL